MVVAAKKPRNQTKPSANGTAKHATAGRTKISLIPNGVVSAAVAELRSLQRSRVIVIKSRIMQSNRLQAIVAGTLGYNSGMQESDRRQKFEEATQVIKDVADKKSDHPLKSIIETTLVGINAFVVHQDDLEKRMIKHAKTLPVAAWVEEPEQSGFGLKSLATLIGECGDLSNYSSPAKVWKRMGLAPHTFDGKTLMCSTWRSGREGKLPTTEWAESVGYSPRRRSIAYLFGEGIVKQNKIGAGDDEADALFVPGPYRLRYDSAKVKAYESHPEWDWKPCGWKSKDKKHVCKKGKVGRNKCPACGGTGMKCKRAHLHGMTCATKMLLKELWRQWRKQSRG